MQKVWGPSFFEQKTHSYWKAETSFQVGYVSKLCDILRTFVKYFETVPFCIKKPKIGFEGPRDFSDFFLEESFTTKVYLARPSKSAWGQIFSINSPRPNKNNLTDAMPIWSISLTKNRIFSPVKQHKKSQHPYAHQRPPSTSTFRAPDPKGRCRPSK